MYEDAHSFMGGSVDTGSRVDDALDGRMMNSNPHLGMPRALGDVTSC